MVTERRSVQQVACRLKVKVICSLASCLVHLDAGSTNLLAQQNLLIPEHAHNRTLPSWLLDPHLSARDRLDSPPVALMPFWSLHYPMCLPLLY